MIDHSAAVAMTYAGRLEQAAFATLIAFVAALQISIAIAETLLALTGALWIALLIVQRERLTAPSWFWLLAAYAGLTLLSATLSLAPITSLTDSKQLLLFLIVPVVYRLARGPKALTLATVIISVGAASAILGIVQYGILEYDNLGRRPQGSLTHYMTYSGLLDAGRRHGRRARALPRSRSHLARARDARAGRRPGAHLHPKRLGGQLPRRRSAVGPEGPPTACAAARGRRAVFRAGPLPRHRPPLFDVRSAGPDESRSRGHGAYGCPPDSRLPDHRRRP